MSFISFSFLVFFPIVTAVYFLLPQRLRWVWLLFSSCIFYMAFIPGYILVLFALIVVDYTAGRLLEKTQGRTRVYVLLTSILMTIGVLLVFKYFNFLSISAGNLMHALHLSYAPYLLSWALPLGLSFHTFQSLSYVIEVYRGKYDAEHHFGIYALYVMFYPQLVAGPIERPQQLLVQLHEPHHFHYDRARIGLIRMAWGFFKKMTVADRIGIIVDPIFAHPTLHPGLPLIVASMLFTIQIYLDFSAYCDIALGAAQIMGFTLMENFNRPFIAKSIAEFWRRWHISLSSWFRDYFYYPLLFSQKRKNTLTMYGAILLTFIVTGFWHGASWGFGIFGLLHGTYIVFGTATQRYRERFNTQIGLTRLPRLHATVQILITFACVAFAFIFFRAHSTTDAFYIATHLFSSMSLHELVDIIALKQLMLVAGLTGIVFLAEFSQENKPIANRVASWWWPLRWSTYWACIYVIVAFSTSSYSPFIYFQF